MSEKDESINEELNKINGDQANTQDQSDSQVSSKESENPGVESEKKGSENPGKKLFDFSKTGAALKGVVTELVLLLKKLVPAKSKKTNKTPGEKEGQPVLGGKPPSKIPYILGKTKLGLKKSASSVGKKSKSTYRKGHTYLKNKGVIDKINNNKRLSYSLLAGVLILFVLMLVLVFSSNHKHSNHGPNAVSNLMRINNMQGALGKIQTNITMRSQMTTEDRQKVENKLQEIDAKLGQISSGAGVAQGQKIKDLRATLQSKSVNLSQKICALSGEIKQIKSKVFPAPTLSAKALPFKVMAIEPWNGKPFIEIQQKQNSTMIDYVGLYGVRGGWKVIDVNAPEQTATFLNENGQVVHVAVNFKQNSGD